jgi:hypothetical protein
MSLTYSQIHPNFGSISSTEQSVYLFEKVLLNDIPLENDDWVIAFNGDVCVGYFQWNTSNCGGEICGVPAYGDDGNTFTEGFLNQGDTPTFKIHDTSEDAYHDAIPSENIPWENGEIHLIDELESFSYHDCDGNWGGSAIIDDCGICSEGFTGHVPNSDKDCAGTCPNQSEDMTFYGSCMLNYETPQPGFCGYDECGICDGNGANIMCWDESFVCNIDDCPFNPSDCPEGTTFLNYYLGNNDAKDAQKCIPDSFLNDGGSIESSTKQFSYIFHVVTLNGELIDTTDWVAAFNGDVCVGAKLWDTSNCNGNVCNVVVMGFETNDPEATQGYCESGDVPTFKIYDMSENAYHDAIPSENIPWDPLSGSTFIDNLSFCNLAIDCIGECGGMAEIDECGTCNGNGIMEGACDCEGNMDPGCGCDEPPPSSYCLDLDGDNLGDPFNEILACDAPQDYVSNCDDLEPECMTNDTDTCGVCGGNGPEPDYDCEGNMSAMTHDDPHGFSLSNIYPNPFNPILNISYKLPIASYTSIIVHDINGKKITKINNGFQSSGNYSTNWGASNQASGVYLINLVNEHNKSLTKIQKAILIK